MLRLEDKQDLYEASRRCWFGAAIYDDKNPDKVLIVVAPYVDAPDEWKIWLDGARNKFPKAKSAVLYNMDGEEMAGWY